MPGRRVASVTLVALLAAGCVPDDWRPGAPADAASPDVTAADVTAPDVAAPDVAAAGDGPCVPGTSRCGGACVADPVSRYRADDDAQDEFVQHPGTAVNGVTYADGRFGRAFVIAGRAQYVELPAAVATFGEQDFTLSLWFNTTHEGELLAQRAQCWDAPLHLGEDLGVSYQGQVAVEMFTVNGYFVLRSEPGYNDGAWHQVALVRRGAQIELVVDARTVSSHAIDGTFDDPSHTPIYLGTSRCVMGAPGSNGTYDTRRWYRGMIDEVAFYRRALSLDELAAQMQGLCDH